MRKLFNFFATCGVVLTLTELVLNFSNSDLCNSYGCKLARNSVTIPDSWVIAAGAVAFAILLLLSVLRKDELLDGFISVILSVEGVFVSYQVFRMKHICHFCISVFFIFLVLSLIRLFMKRWTVAIGFFSFVTILFVFSILKPYANTSCKLSRYTLIYSPTCSHCEEVIHYLKKRNSTGISVSLVKASSCMPFLKLIGVHAVPVLIVKKDGKLSWLVGDKKIIEYFNSLNKASTTQGNSILNGNYELFLNTNTKGGFCGLGNNSKCR